MPFPWFQVFTVNTIDKGGNGSFHLCLLCCKILWLPVILHYLPEYTLELVLSTLRFLSSLVAGNLWIFLALDTLSSHVLTDCISISGPADWPCTQNPLCCTSIWVVLGLDSLSLCVLECYTDNSYSTHWPCKSSTDHHVLTCDAVRALTPILIPTALILFHSAINANILDANKYLFLHNSG